MKKFFFLNSILLTLFLIDRLSKYLVLNKLPTSGVYFFSSTGFKIYKNTGISFGVKINPILIQILTIIIIFFLIYAIIKKCSPKNKWQYFFLSLILIGAISNLIDRFQYKYEIDFISLGKYFPIFNLSDLYISLGALIYVIIDYHKK